MNFHEFVLSDDRIKSELIYKEGIYISKRRIEDFSAVLYQLNTFYVEIIYKKYRYEIFTVECFLTTDILDEYPEQYCIEEFVL